MASASEFVTLRGGLVLPLAALQLAWSLEDRGLCFALDGDRLVVGPKERLTDDDRDAIRRWRDHLCAIVGYEPGCAQ